MRCMKMMGIAAMAITAMAFLAGGSASAATVLEVGGTPKTESIALTMSLKPGTSLALRDTFGFAVNTCTESHVAGKTESGFSTTPTGKLSELAFGKCDHTVTVHNPGKLYVEWTSGTNGRVYSEEAEITAYSTMHGTHINCTTESGTPIGTLTGVKEGHATLDISATLNCGGPHLSSAKLTGTYIVTSPTGLGVASPTPLPPTLEVTGTPKTESIALTMSLKPGTSLALRDTFGFAVNTCTESHLKGQTEKEHNETTVTGAVEELSFSGCQHTVTVHNPGKLYVEWTSGTNGRVYSEEAEITTYSTIHGTHVNCKTGEGTSIGTLTGVKEGHATLDVNATLTCGGSHMSSAKLTGTYTVTSPTGLGVANPAPLPPTLEVAGIPKTESIALTMSLKTGTSLTLRDTFGFFANTCTESHLKGQTEKEHNETTVTGAVDELSFSGCKHTVTVHNPGKLYVEWTSGTNGRVYSEEAEVTAYSTIHETHINCKTPEAGTPIGTLTGVKEGHATLDINATLNCGPHLSSAKLVGTYTVTSPTGLGVSP